VKIFISYRRDDTGGRAGRLSDQLTARFGARDVFQDVRTVVPGHDFTVQVEQAIEASGVVLVLIGPRWLRTAPGDARTRLDDPADYVRREVATALATGAAVVPVLVDGARLPSTDDLPTDVQPLLRRQAFELRDESWHDDVQRLVRALEGEPVAQAVRRPWIPVVLVVVAALVVAGIAWAIASGEDPDDEEGEVPTGFGTIDDDGNVGTCPDPDPDDGWTELDVATSPVEGSDEDGVEYRLTPVAAAVSSVDDEWRIIVTVDVANVTADPSVAPAYVGLGMVGELFVDGLSQGAVQCASVAGNPNIASDQRAVGTFGFDSSVDPSGATLSLSIADATVEYAVTP
jgi:negative regulator of sigma E activity